ncbi:MAG: DUF3622 domain-containing protein [Oceanicoccus sp.]|uniref:DUF3622 domain-containing protein n=1 Tax=Oceanicoccus sp. TaxID=2691044 RepID=UPI002615B1E4|nr:DUF3622 domain-containing protein [Oceanicoccus sp.]MCP3907662.1 DUF3622 domain-containing protein [Oceanicoccus sp.]
MSKDKKFSYQVQEEEGTWKADIIRKVSARKTTVSKTQSGFASEQEATAWADAELQAFMKQLGERNKRRDKKRD